MEDASLHFHVICSTWAEVAESNSLDSHFGLRLNSLIGSVYLREEIIMADMSAAASVQDGRLRSIADLPPHVRAAVASVETAGSSANLYSLRPGSDMSSAACISSSKLHFPAWRRLS